MLWKKLTPPRPATLFPAWIIFSTLFAALFASHFTLLALPYYWDEAGYYIPAAWDFFRTGSLIPITTLTNAHPPLPSVFLAIAWKLFGYCPLVTRLAALAVASLGLTAVWRLAMRLVGIPAVAFWTVALTALYPIWFAQSSLAHADIFAAACTLWGLVNVLSSPDQNNACKPWAAALCFALAALSKETAIAVPLTLAAVSLFESLRTIGASRIRLRREAAWLASCVLPLATWYAYHHYKTGFLFGNPEFLRYNAQANLEPLRILAAFGHRILHLTAHMNLFVPVAAALAALLLPLRSDDSPNLEDMPGAPSISRPLRNGWETTNPNPTSANISNSNRVPGAPSYCHPERAKRVEGSAFCNSGAWVGNHKPRPANPNNLDGQSRGNHELKPHPAIHPAALRRILLLLLMNAALFSVLGGALLTRYLLPMYPLVLLLALTTLYRRIRWWQGLAAFSAAAFVLGLFVNPPYGFAPEDNLAYASVIRLHQTGIAQLNQRYPGATVLSAWPVTDELTRPELGYVAQPFAVVPIEDFSAVQIARAAQEPEKYSVALVFSTKYNPASPLFTLGPKSKALDEHYFGLHHDLPPEAIAFQLHGDLVWQKQDHGQWIALIRFNRQFDARLEPAP